MRGFSLAEIVVAVALMGLLAGLAVVRLQGAREGRCNEAAERVVEELKLARNKAVSSGEPVAFAIPHAAHSPVFYLCEGRQNPKVTTQSNLSADHKGVELCPVYWPGPTYLASSSLSLDVEVHGFDFSLWNPQNPKDYMLVFLPSGAVINNKVAFDGSYHFVVAKGVDAGSSTVQGVDSFLLSGANDPWTVTVTPLGQVTAERGLPGSGGGLENPALSFGSSSPSVPAPPANTDPRDLIISVYPQPNANVAAMGVDATVREDGFLTLKAEATDDQADQLRCIWHCSDNDGAFSYDQEMEMEWNGQTSRWEAVWEWYPPVPDLKGLYILSCDVVDGQGGSVSGLIPVSGRVKVTHDGRIAYSSNETGDWEVYTCNPDGTDIVNVTKSPTSDDRDPVWTVDGGKLVYISDISGTPQVYVMDKDGKNRKQISTGPGQKSMPALSPRGTTVAWSMFGAAFSHTELWMANLDGTDQTLVYDSTGQFTRIEGITFHRDGDVVLFGAGNPNAGNGYQDKGYEIWKINTDGTALKQLTNYPTETVREPDISRVDGRVAFYSYGDSGWLLYIADYDKPSESLTVTTTHTMPLGRSESPRWSPDASGQLVVGQWNTNADKDLYLVDAATGATIRQLVDNTGNFNQDDGTWSRVSTAP